MKVLCASLAIDGHVNPLTGIAKRLQAGGHEVAWYTGPSYQRRMDDLGIPLRPFRRAIEHTQDNLNDVYPERTKLHGPRLIAFDGEKVFASNVAAFFEDIRELRDDFPFDILLADGAVYVQRLVATMLGMPVVSVVNISNMQRDQLVPPLFFGLQPATNVRGRLRDQALHVLSDRVVMAPARRTYIQALRRYGLDSGAVGRFADEPYVTSAAIIQNGPESFDYPRAVTNPRVHYVGPLLAYRQAQHVDPPAPVIGTRTVLVTQGTVDNKDQSKLIVPALEALAQTELHVIVSTGRVATADLRARFGAPNRIIEDYVDFDTVLPQTDVFVTNGGFGGVMLSLNHGVPLVCAGRNEGKNDVCAHVAHHGVGIDLRTERPTPGQIGRAVGSVLTQPSWRTRAQAFGAEMNQLNPAQTAAHIVETAAEQPPPTTSRTATRSQ
jgi:MGT family glycosyltransferase